MVVTLPKSPFTRMPQQSPKTNEILENIKKSTEGEKSNQKVITKDTEKIYEELFKKFKNG